MAVTINASTSTGLVQSADTSGQIELQTNGTTVATVNTSNNVQFRGSISVGNVTPTTSGAGITFPATQSASSDANTLDDYEEGTWTPAFSASGATFTYGGETGGWYTKIGRVVTVGFTLSTAARSGGSGQLTITGLPFTSGNVTNGFSAGCVGTVNRWAHSASYVQWGIRVETNATQITIWEFGQAGAQVNDSPAQVSTIPTGTSTNSTLSVTYYV